MESPRCARRALATRVACVRVCRRGGCVLVYTRPPCVGYWAPPRPPVAILRSRASAFERTRPRAYVCKTCVRARRVCVCAPSVRVCVRMCARPALSPFPPVNDDATAPGRPCAAHRPPPPPVALSLKRPLNPDRRPAGARSGRACALRRRRALVPPHARAFPKTTRRRPHLTTTSSRRRLPICTLACPRPIPSPGSPSSHTRRTITHAHNNKTQTYTGTHSTRSRPLKTRS